MGDPLEATAGYGRARGHKSGCGGGSRHWCSPACGVPAPRIDPGLRALGQKHRKVGQRLTEGSDWPEMERSRVDGGVRRRRSKLLAWSGARAILQASRSHRRTRRVPAEVPQKSTGPEIQHR